MSLDAMVWLVVGIGVGIGACFLLLVLYASLERWRLGRRIQRARVLKTAAPRGVVQTPVPSGSKLALLDRKKAREEKAPASPHSAEQTTKASDEPVAVAQPLPRRELPPRREPAAPTLEPGVPQPTPRAAPVLTVVRPEPEPVPAVEAVPEVAVAEAGREVPAGPVLATEAEPADDSAAPAPPRAAQSVEDMFAEAFALEKVAVAPLKRESDDKD